MKKLLFILPILLVIAIGLFLFNQKEGTKNATEVIETTPSTNPTDNPKPVNIKASFEIYTLGTKRIFTSSMYHDLSGDVYITSNDPSIIHVEKSGITWSDFFETLPMELTKECLTTGTGQTFCSNDNYELKFFIDDNRDPNALDKEIKADDKLRVLYE